MEGSEPRGTGFLLFQNDFSDFHHDLPRGGEGSSGDEGNVLNSDVEDAIYAQMYFIDTASGPAPEQGNRGRPHDISIVLSGDRKGKKRRKRGKRGRRKNHLKPGAAQNIRTEAWGAGSISKPGIDNGDVLQSDHWRMVSSHTGVELVTEECLQEREDSRCNAVVGKDKQTLGDSLLSDALRDTAKPLEDITPAIKSKGKSLVKVAHSTTTMKSKGNFSAEVAGSEVIVVGDDSDDSEYIIISDSSSGGSVESAASDGGEVSDMDQCSLDEGISNPDDPDLWRINKKDMMGRTDYDKMLGIKPWHQRTAKKCPNCKQKGHSQLSCPHPIRHLTCYLCAGLDHISFQCPFELCPYCFQPRHRGKPCSVSWANPRTECNRCYMIGHHASMCTDIWRQFHNTTHSDSHLVMLKAFEQRQNKRIFCYNCAKKGHFGFECTKNRPRGWPLPNFPLIAHYDAEWPPKGRVENKPIQRQLKRSGSYTPGLPITKKAREHGYFPSGYCEPKEQLKRRKDNHRYFEPFQPHTLPHQTQRMTITYDPTTSTRKAILPFPQGDPQPPNHPFLQDHFLPPRNPPPPPPPALEQYNRSHAKVPPPPPPALEQYNRSHAKVPPYPPPSQLHRDHSSSHTAPSDRRPHYWDDFPRIPFNHRPSLRDSRRKKERLFPEEAPPFPPPSKHYRRFSDITDTRDPMSGYERLPEEHVRTHRDRLADSRNWDQQLPRFDSPAKKPRDRSFRIRDGHLASDRGFRGSEHAVRMLNSVKYDHEHRRNSYRY